MRIKQWIHRWLLQKSHYLARHPQLSEKSRADEMRDHFDGMDAVNAIRCPSRVTTINRCDPGLADATTSLSAAQVSTFCPATVTKTSPDFRPADSASDPASTPEIRRPPGAAAVAIDGITPSFA